MSQTPVQALEVLLERAVQERDRLAVDLRRGDEVATRVRRQGEQLSTYRSEYQQRWTSQFNRGGAIEILHCYQSFMQRLDDALLQQQRQVEAAERALASVREALMQAEIRVASLKKLIERRQGEQQRESQRRDQLRTDEAAQQLVSRRARPLVVQH